MFHRQYFQVWRCRSFRDGTWRGKPGGGHTLILLSWSKCFDTWERRWLFSSSKMPYNIKYSSIITESAFSMWIQNWNISQFNANNWGKDLWGRTLFKLSFQSYMQAFLELAPLRVANKVYKYGKTFMIIMEQGRQSHFTSNCDIYTRSHSYLLTHRCSQPVARPLYSYTLITFIAIESC